jgi:hypothetical protein
MAKNKNRDRTQQQPRSAGARGSEQSKNAAEAQAETMQSPAGSSDAARKNRKSGGHN